MVKRKPKSVPTPSLGSITIVVPTKGRLEALVSLAKAIENLSTNTFDTDLARAALECAKALGSAPIVHVSHVNVSGATQNGFLVTTQEAETQTQEFILKQEVGL